MSDQNDNDNNDLTRIEDLSEFLHQDDPETDLLFQEDEEDQDQLNDQAYDQEEDQDSPPPLDSISDNEDYLSALESTESMEETDETSSFETPDFNENSEEDYENFHEEEDYTESDYGNFDSDKDSNEEEEMGEEGFEQTQSFSYDSEEDLREDDTDSFQGPEELDDNQYSDEDESYQDNLDNESTEDKALDFQENFPENLEENYQDQADNTAPDHEDHEDHEVQEDLDYPDTDLTPELPALPDTEDVLSSSESYEVLEKEQEALAQGSEVLEDIKSRPREDFSEVKTFQDNMSYGTVATGGSPAFSILIRGIISQDFNDSIIATLNEHGLIGSDEDIIRNSLDLGQLLIPQISEFSAIYLAGKLRKYATEIKIGLAEEIHPSKSYEFDNKGLVTKRSIFQNRDLKYQANENPTKLEDIIVISSSSVQGHQVEQHLGVIKEAKLYDLGDLTQEKFEFEKIDEQLVQVDHELAGPEIYNILAKSLKEQAHKMGANAVLSLSYSLTPVIKEGTNLYHIICTGDAVILSQEN